MGVLDGWMLICTMETSFKKKLIDLTGYALYNNIKNLIFKNSLIIHKGKKNKEIKVLIKCLYIW